MTICVISGDRSPRAILTSHPFFREKFLTAVLIRVLATLGLIQTLERRAWGSHNWVLVKATAAANCPGSSCKKIHTGASPFLKTEPKFQESIFIDFQASDLSAWNNVELAKRLVEGGRLLSKKSWLIKIATVKRRFAIIRSRDAAGFRLRKVCASSGVLHRAGRGSSGWFSCGWREHGITARIAVRMTVRIAEWRQE